MSEVFDRGAAHRVVAGRRVLVVEDSFMIAWSLRQMLTDLGCTVLGPVGDVATAMELIHAGNCDAAILDVNLDGQTSMPIAEALAAKGCPFLFVTGYSSPMLVEPRFQDRARLRKPVTESNLHRALLETLGGVARQ
ncbi:MAG: response regulator [Phycisphaerales bacterium]